MFLLHVPRASVPVLGGCAHTWACVNIMLSDLCGKLYSCFCKWEVSFRSGIKAVPGREPGVCGKESRFWSSDRSFSAAVAQIPRASFLAQGFLSGCRGFAAKPSLWEGRQGPGRNLNCGRCHTSCFSQSPREDAEVQTLSISGRVLQISDAQQSSVLVLLRGPSCHGGALLCEESEQTQSLSGCSVCFPPRANFAG